MDIGGLLGDSRVIVPNRVALRVSEIHFLPHRRIFNHVFGSLAVLPSSLRRHKRADITRRKFNEEIRKRR